MGNEELEYLSKRAKLISEFIIHSSSKNLFPYRDELKKDVEQRISEGKIRRLRIINNIFDNVIIEENDLSNDEKFELMKSLTKEIGEEKNGILIKKRNQYNLFVKEGFIKSRLKINDAISIRNSSILGLTPSEKDELQGIILGSVGARI